MKIVFSTHKLEKTFNKGKALNRKYGARLAGAIADRMAILNATSSLAQVPITPPDRCHQLTEDRKGQIAVDLIHLYRLVFIPYHEPLPRADDGGINLQQVTETKMLEVIEYH